MIHINAFHLGILQNIDASLKSYCLEVVKVMIDAGGVRLSGGTNVTNIGWTLAAWVDIEETWKFQQRPNN